MRLVVAMVCSTVAGFAFPTSLALAQLKTVTACQAEWRANKEVYHLKGITEKEYVDECRDLTAPPLLGPLSLRPDRVSPSPYPRPTSHK